MDIVGNIYYRKTKGGNEAVMVVNRMEDEVYYRDIWGVNRGNNFILHVDDDITINEINYLFSGNEYIIKNINDVSEDIKQDAINCLFKSKIEYKS